MYFSIVSTLSAKRIFIFVNRELESKLSVERSLKERTEAALDETRQQLQRCSAPANTHPPEHYEKKISDLKNELDQVSCSFEFCEV